MTHNQTRSLLLAAALGLSLLGPAPALAQRGVLELPQPALPLADPSEAIDNKRIEARLQREEKALRELRQIVLQAKAQGAPVEVKDAGPDPQIGELRTRIGDLEETLRKQTGQMELTAHDAAVAAKSAADANEANKALIARLETLEKQLAAAPVGPPPPPPLTGGAVNPGSGVLGTLSGPASGSVSAPADAAGGDEPTIYRQARQTLDSGDYVGGATALQDYLQRFPNSPRAPEANYWLGRTLALRNMHAEAAGAYARALKGWPQTTWGGDAVLRLSSSLIELKRNPDACRALTEFDSRYAAKAAPALKSRAKDTRALAACA